MASTVKGTVKDSAGAVITSAVVTAPPYTVTNTNGSYIFTTPTTTTVNVTASAPNYVSQTKSVTATNGTTKTVNFTLAHV